MIHSMKQTKTIGMLIKVDLLKAYDKVGWTFLKAMLKAFGFQHCWVKGIHKWVSTTFFSILVNGGPSATFNSSRVLRQGDPLSPYLFILSAEGLGRVLKTQQEEGTIQGIGHHVGVTPQTHQQFVDDTMLMGISLVREARAINETMDTFKQANGLEVNKEKSQMYFFNTSVVTRRNILRILEFIEGTLPSKYLGAPLLEGKMSQRN